MQPFAPRRNGARPRSGTRRPPRDGGDGGGDRLSVGGLLAACMRCTPDWLPSSSRGAAAAGAPSCAPSCTLGRDTNLVVFEAALRVERKSGLPPNIGPVC